MFYLAIAIQLNFDHCWQYSLHCNCFLIPFFQVGTARYMAPEKLCGTIDRANPWISLCLIDVYASALVAYEIMSRCSFSMNTVHQGTCISYHALSHYFNMSFFHQHFLFSFILSPAQQSTISNHDMTENQSI